MPLDQMTVQEMTRQNDYNFVKDVCKHNKIEKVVIR